MGHSEAGTSHSGAERVIVEQNRSSWSRAGHSGVKRVIVERRASHSKSGQFQNLPQCKPYKLGFLGAGYVISYRKEKRVVTGAPRTRMGMKPKCWRNLVHVPDPR